MENIIMSILGKNHNDPVSPAQRASTRIKRQASRLAETIVRDWESGFDNLWNRGGVDASDILVELGTDAAEIIQLSSLTYNFMLSVLDADGGEWALETKARLEAKEAARPSITINGDGTVTLD